MLAVFKFVYVSIKSTGRVYEDYVCRKEEKEKPGSFKIKCPVGGVYMEEGQPSW